MTRMHDIDNLSTEEDPSPYSMASSATRSLAASKNIPLENLLSISLRKTAALGLRNLFRRRFNFLRLERRTMEGGRYSRALLPSDKVVRHGRLRRMADGRTFWEAIAGQRSPSHTIKTGSARALTFKPIMIEVEYPDRPQSLIER